MKTQIFKDYSDFLNRSDEKINGVTQKFADANDGWDKERGNKGCWNCSGCSDCSDCSGCSDCSDCSGCSDCSNIAWLREKKNLSPEPQAEGEKPGFPNVPIIENIHQKIYEAVQKPDALDMSDWHTCETTHCRAGWAVHLAGEAGKKLEEKTSTLFAAMQIYKASSPIRVWPTKFYGTNEMALEDIKKCAEEEKAIII